MDNLQLPIPPEGSHSGFSFHETEKYTTLTITAEGKLTFSGDVDVAAQQFLDHFAALFQTELTKARARIAELEKQLAVYNPYL